MMSFKLAFSNVRKSFKDYGIYFLTLMFGVCIFYLFNSIESQQSMMQISSSQQDTLKSITQLMSYISVFISVILGFLIIYANRFLIKRRKKELGIYQLLGMRKGQISRILIVETLFVAIISLAVGLLIGVLASQGFALLTAYLFEVKLKSFVFIFSSAAAVKSIIYFGIAFVFVMMFNSISVSKQKLITLLYANRSNEKFKTPHLLLSVVLFIVSVICLVTAYVLIIKHGIVYMDTYFWISIILGIVGTFLFFLSLSGFFLKVIQQNNRIYLKNLNMYVLRQINSKINTTYISMTLVCLMLFVSICALSSGLGMSKAMSADKEKQAPYEATISYSRYDNGTPMAVDLKKELESVGVDFNSFASEVYESKQYVTEPPIKFTVSAALTGGMGVENFPLFIKLSDYNKLMQMQEKPVISLGENEYIANINLTPLQKPSDEYFKTTGLTVGNQKMTYNGYISEYVYNSYQGDENIILIVNDDIVENNNMEVINNNICINYIKDNDKYEKLFTEAINYQTIRNIHKTLDNANDLGYSEQILTRADVFEIASSTSVTVAYLAVYLGIVFLLISATVLAITQLSEANDNIKRYNLLKKLGAESSMINKALFTQIAIFFLVPLLLAIVHSIVGIRVASDVVSLFGSMNIFRDTLVAAVVIAIIYGGYFLATYLSSRNMISKSNMNS